MSIPSQVANVRWNLNPPPASGPHAYFDQWAADARCVNSHSMRSDADLLVMAKGWNNSLTTAAPGWIYDPAKDAAKGTLYLDSDSLTPQLWMRPPHTITTGTVLTIWDTYIPSAWATNARILAPKTFHVRVGSDLLRMETRLQNKKNQLPVVATVDWHAYGAYGPGTFEGSLPVGNPCRFSSETVQPMMACFQVMADMWTRFWIFTELNVGGSDLWSLWAADVSREPVQLYNRIALVLSPGVAHFDFEYNSSQGMAGLPADSFYHRDYLMLAGLTLQDMQGLLLKPVA